MQVQGLLCVAQCVGPAAVPGAPRVRNVIKCPPPWLSPPGGCHDDRRCFKSLPRGCPMTCAQACQSAGGGCAPPHTRGSPQSATAASWLPCSPRAWCCLAIPFHLLPDSSNDRFTTGFCKPPTATSSLSRGSVPHLNAGEQGDLTGACFPTTGPVARTALLASGPLHLCCQSTASFCCRCCCRCFCSCLVSLRR